MYVCLRASDVIHLCCTAAGGVQPYIAQRLHRDLVDVHWATDAIFVHTFGHSFRRLPPLTDTTIGFVELRMLNWHFQMPTNREIAHPKHMREFKVEVKTMIEARIGCIGANLCSASAS